MNEINKAQLEMLKGSFLEYINKNKKTNSREFQKYSIMTISELITEIEKDIHKYKISPSLYIGYLCDNMGLDYDEHYEQLCNYFNLFSDLIDIIYEV